MNTDYQVLSQSLKHAKYRMTPQRIAICKILAESPDHPSAQMVYDMLKPKYPSLSLTTVYNTLETLVGLGVISPRHGSGDAPTRYDANTTPHAHLQCIRCNKLRDFDSQHVTDLNKDVSARAGYHIIGSYLLYYGLCESCQEKENNEE